MDHAPQLPPHGLLPAISGSVRVYEAPTRLPEGEARVIGVGSRGIH